MLKDVLNRVELSSDIDRVRVEIESSKPFLQDAPQQSASTKHAEESEQNADEGEPDAEYVCECGDRFESAGGLGSHRKYCDAAEIEAETDVTAKADPSDSHPTDALLASDGGDTATTTGDSSSETASPDSPSSESGENTGEAAKDYLASDLPEKVRDGEVAPDDFRDVLTAPLNPETNKWYVCGLLYRTQGALSLGQIAAMLEDTDWEMPYASVSSTLHKAKSNGFVYKKQRGIYQLTQLGRDYIKTVANHTPGYALQTADDINDSSAGAEA